MERAAKTPVVERSNFMTMKKDVSTIGIGDWYNPHTFYHLMAQDTWTLTRWMQDNNILLQEYTCPKCKKKCELKPR